MFVNWSPDKKIKTLYNESIANIAAKRFCANMK